MATEAKILATCLTRESETQSDPPSRDVVHTKAQSMGTLLLLRVMFNTPLE